jgi:adenylate cyclase
MTVPLSQEGASSWRVLLAKLRVYPWLRSLKLWSGVVLFIFVLTHLLNHAIGIFGIEAMEMVQDWRYEFWHTRFGGMLLYGSFTIHILLALQNGLRRRTWRMPLTEAVQLGFGLVLPFLLVGHLVATRVGGAYFEVDSTYGAFLSRTWPHFATTQTALLIAAWTHGVIGIHQTIRHRKWFAGWKDALLILAVMIPCLALAGFVAGGREAALRAVDPLSIAQAEGLARVRDIARMALFGVLGAIILVILARFVRARASGRVAIRYRGHGSIRMSRGMTLLEASRLNKIPHPSLCGGRARCSTCRVHVLSGGETLPAPGPAEQKILERVGAPPSVRLACQIRPTESLSVQILVPAFNTSGKARLEVEGEQIGTAQDATILIVGMRAFTAFSRAQQPYEVAVLLNRLFLELRQASEAHGGRVDRMRGDEMMAVFATGSGRKSASRSAILAARDMLKSIDALNAELSSAMSLPLRIGIGIHCGSAIIARIMDSGNGDTLTALGQTVSIAGRLEMATKELLCDCLISAEAALDSGLSFSSLNPKDIVVKGLEAPLRAYAIADLAAFDGVLQAKTSRAIAGDKEVVVADE